MIIAIIVIKTQKGFSVLHKKNPFISLFFDSNIDLRLTSNLPKICLSQETPKLNYYLVSSKNSFTLSL